MTACGMGIDAKRITSMIAAEGWTVRTVHSPGCTSGVSEYLVVAWAATERHGLQPVCLTPDGAMFGLVEDLTVELCVDQCTIRILRVVEL